MHEEDGTFEMGGGSGEVLRRAVGDVYNVCFDAAGRRGRGPPEADGAKREFNFSE